MQLLEQINTILNRLLVFIAGFFLVAMITMTCANIFLRIFWTPIRGTYELMGFFGAVMTAFALGYTQTRRGHIAVDVLVNAFSVRLKNILFIISNCLCSLFFIVAAWQLAVKARTLMRTGEVTETLRIIYYPFTIAVALGCAVLALVMVTDLMRYLLSLKEGNH